MSVFALIIIKNNKKQVYMTNTIFLLHRLVTRLLMFFVKINALCTQKPPLTSCHYEGRDKTGAESLTLLRLPVDFSRRGCLNETINVITMPDTKCARL